MSADGWGRIENITRNLVRTLVEQGTVAEPCHLSVEAETAADAWIRTLIYAADGRQPTLPIDQMVRRSLLARCSYAASQARDMQTSTEACPADSDVALLEIYLIALWHQEFRSQWLESYAPMDSQNRQIP